MLSEDMMKLFECLDKLSDDWFDYCQGIRDDVPEAYIANVLEYHERIKKPHKKKFTFDGMMPLKANSSKSGDVL